MGSGYPRYAFYRFRIGATHHTLEGPELIMDFVDRLEEFCLSRKPIKATNDGHHFVDVTFTNDVEETLFLTEMPDEFRILRGG